MDRDFLLYYLNQYPFPQEAKDALIAGFDGICKDREMKQVLTDAIAAYENREAESWEEMLALLRKVGGQAISCAVPIETVELLFFILCAKELKNRYLEKGNPLSCYDGIASDFCSKLNECHKVRGIWGSFVAHWFIGFFLETRFVIGRLQFEIVNLPPCISPDGKYCFNGETAINIHIPSGKPLCREDVHKAMAEAAVFFGDRFPEDQVLFTCNSWLLFPGHREMLPESSGIRRFMEEFTVISVDIHQKDLWRIFDTDALEDLDSLPQNTTLQKCYVNWLKAGKPVGTARGIRYLKKE